MKNFKILRNIFYYYSEKKDIKNKPVILILIKWYLKITKIKLKICTILKKIYDLFKIWIKNYNYKHYDII